MRLLLNELLPVVNPSPFLRIVGDCFAGALPLTAIITISIRFGWRRGKGMYDL